MGEQNEEFIFKNSKICFLSSFPPRECGIATFTKDLCNSMNKKYNPRLKSRVIAINENNSLYNYGSKVLMELNRDDIQNFMEVARRINRSKDIKLVCIQHEFGLFGGDFGSYLVPFFETIEKPVVTTFHSVLPKPDALRKKVVKFICDKSSAIIVMSKFAIDILAEDYGAKRGKIFYVPHGVPNAQLTSQERLKSKLNLKGRTVLSTFGLLSKGKGVEYVIRALPDLVKKYPDLIYLVIGETHPIIRKKEGESYRNELMKEVEKLGLKNHVRFYNRYVTLKEIIEYLLASDIYLCTNLDENQIVSGTLSYALSCGRATISTPSIYAKDVLANDKGVVLDDFKSSDSYFKAIDSIISNPEFKKTLEENAYAIGRLMIWPNVASQYLSIFNKVVKLREEVVEKYPTIKLNHLKRMTDDFGMIQFCDKTTPDKASGYTVDDNTRALIVATIHNNLFNTKESEKLSSIYLNFIDFAQDDSGWFNTVVNTNSGEKHFSQDSFGRAMWSLGYAIRYSSNKDIEKKAITVFDKGYKNIKDLVHLRAKAFTLEGLYHYYKKHPHPGLLYRIKKMADSLVEAYQKNSTSEWEWFEESLTYSNSSLPESLYLAYEATKDKLYLEIAEKTFNFLSRITFINNEYLSPIGQNGWFNRNGDRAFFDQQPIDAASMVQTCLIAAEITGNKDYYKKAVLSFNWFLGRNHLKQTMYDEVTGGCYDGLADNSVNLNQGAESTVSYLMARLFLEERKKNIKTKETLTLQNQT